MFTFKNLKNHFHSSKLVLLFQKYFKFDPQISCQMLRGEIVAFDHYHPLGGRTMGQG
jgi:hypothetical protein